MNSGGSVLFSAALLRRCSSVCSPAASCSNRAISCVQASWGGGWISADCLHVCFINTQLWLAGVSHSVLDTTDPASHQVPSSCPGGSLKFIVEERENSMLAARVRHWRSAHTHGSKSVFAAAQTARCDRKWLNIIELLKLKMSGWISFQCTNQFWFCSRSYFNLHNVYLKDSQPLNQQQRRRLRRETQIHSFPQTTRKIIRGWNVCFKQQHRQQHSHSVECIPPPGPAVPLCSHSQLPATWIHPVPLLSGSIDLSPTTCYRKWDSSSFHIWWRSFIILLTNQQTSRTTVGTKPPWRNKYDMIRY